MIKGKLLSGSISRQHFHEQHVVVALVGKTFMRIVGVHAAKINRPPECKKRMKTTKCSNFLHFVVYLGHGRYKKAYHPEKAAHQRGR